MCKGDYLMKVLFFLATIGFSSHILSADGSDYMLIDDFSGDISNLGTSWEGFTDQVMGGISEMAVTRIVGDSEPYIRMTGNVSLERNGGFIQIRLKFKESGGFDASGYSGIRLKVRGKEKGYYLFLRTTYNILPWKFYKSEFTVSDAWRYVDLPFSSFSGGDYGGIARLDIRRLKSMSITAYGREFQAELEISEAGLYK